jgi:hypothetical protein
VGKMTEMQRQIQEMEFKIEKLREAEPAMEGELNREVDDA